MLDYFLDLPVDMLYKIFSELNPDMLLTLRAVNRQLKKYVDDYIDTSKELLFEYENKFTINSKHKSIIRVSHFDEFHYANYNKESFKDNVLDIFITDLYDIHNLEQLNNVAKKFHKVHTDNLSIINISKYILSYNILGNLSFNYLEIGTDKTLVAQSKLLDKCSKLTIEYDLFKNIDNQDLRYENIDLLDASNEQLERINRKENIIGLKLANTIEQKILEQFPNLYILDYRANIDFDITALEYLQRLEDIYLHGIKSFRGTHHNLKLLCIELHYDAPYVLEFGDIHLPKLNKLMISCKKVKININFQRLKMLSLSNIDYESFNNVKINEDIYVENFYIFGCEIRTTKSIKYNIDKLVITECETLRTLEEMNNVYDIMIRKCDKVEKVNTPLSSCYAITFYLCKKARIIKLNSKNIKIIKKYYLA